LEVVARLKTVRASPRKLRLLTRAVNGMKVDDALDILRFTPTPLAQMVSKTVLSATANAENNFQMNRDNLVIVKIHADEGPRLKRFRAKPRGRIGRIIKPTSHLTVTIDEVEEEETGGRVQSEAKEEDA
jgi:large subunit ribosomal protein L22